MTAKCKFKGMTSNQLGYHNGELYNLDINYMNGYLEIVIEDMLDSRCLYTSVNSFEKNWDVIEINNGNIQSNNKFENYFKSIKRNNIIESIIN